MTATREKTFLLARPEARVLEWIARRLPRFVMPDHLTALGVLAAIGIAVIVATTGTSQVLAQGIALAATPLTVIVGAITHRTQGSVALRPGIVLGVVGMALAIPGALIAFAVPVEALRTGFGVFLLLGSARMFRAARRPVVVEPPP